MTGDVVRCQSCDGMDVYWAGVSPLCAEIQFRCRECGGETWADDTRTPPQAHRPPRKGRAVCIIGQDPIGSPRRQHRRPN